MSDVTKAADGSWTYQCPGGKPSLCGDPQTGQPFVSSGWPSRKVAEARGQQHQDDHAGVAPMPELHEFRAQHGLMPHSDGVRAVQMEDDE